MGKRVGKVMIVGGGTAGWMAATTLLRVIGPGFPIQLIESDAIGTIGVGEATIPSLQLFNELIGLPEDTFMKVTQATFKLGIQFNDWGERGDSYIHSFGIVGKDTGLVDFHHYWLKLQQAQRASDIGDYNIAIAMALRNRFARASTDPAHRKSPLSLIRHAFHFDSGRFARFLRDNCIERGVTRTEGRVVSVQQHPETGHVTSVTMENGDVHTADLFIDCSGFRGLLIEQTLQSGFEDWSHWLPADRAWTVGCESTSPLLPYTMATARDAGWQWRIPLQHRTGNGHVFCSEFTTEEKARDTLIDTLDGAPLGEPRLIKFRTGHRKKFWNKNVVAIGLAAGFIEPLESTSIHLIQSAMMRLMQMFPCRDFEQADADLYNQQCALEFEQVRDFIVLHYIATQREDTAFWRHVKDMPIPESLREKMRLYDANGRIFRDRDELFAPPSWVQVLVGQRVLPRGYDPMVDNMPTSDAHQMLENVKEVMRRTAESLPDHQAYIDQHCKAPPA